VSEGDKDPDDANYFIVSQLSAMSQTEINFLSLKGNSGMFKPRPYFWHETRSSTHREQFGESRRPSEDI